MMDEREIDGGPLRVPLFWGPSPKRELFVSSHVTSPYIYYLGAEPLTIHMVRTGGTESLTIHMVRGSTVKAAIGHSLIHMPTTQ
jgi:hypothetical protein